MKPKMYFDSPLFSQEGIPNAARAYAIMLSNYYDVMISDTKYRSSFENIFMKMYRPIDFDKDDFIYLKIIHPEQWPLVKNRSFFGFHILEGDRLPIQHIEGINNSIVKIVFTPSSFVENLFITQGVKKPIKVVPHAISKKFKPRNIEKDDRVTVFLYIAAIFGVSNSDRKGLDILLWAWKRFENNKHMKLILKINARYAIKANKDLGKTFDLQEYLENVYGGKLPQNIELIDYSLNDADLVKLYNISDCILYPSRGEGFGLVPFEGLGCGTPCIVTANLGMDEYLNHLDGGYARVKVSCLVPGENRYPYFDGVHQSNWHEPDKSDFLEKIYDFLGHKKYYKQGALEASERLHMIFSYEKVGAQLFNNLNQEAFR